MSSFSYFVNDFNGSRLRKVRLRHSVAQSDQEPAYVGKGREVVGFTNILRLISGDQVVEAGQTTEAHKRPDGRFSLANPQFSNKEVFFGDHDAPKRDDGKLLYWRVMKTDWWYPNGIFDLPIAPFFAKCENDGKTSFGMRLTKPAPNSQWRWQFGGPQWDTLRTFEAWIAGGTLSDPLPGTSPPDQFPFNMFNGLTKWYGSYYNRQSNAIAFDMKQEISPKAEFVTYMNHDGKVKRGTFKATRGNIVYRWDVTETFQGFYVVYDATEKLYDQATNSWNIPPFIWFFPNHLAITDPPDKRYPSGRTCLKSCIFDHIRDVLRHRHFAC
jgi:hypothetical protein